MTREPELIAVAKDDPIVKEPELKPQDQHLLTADLMPEPIEIVLSQVHENFAA